MTSTSLLDLARNGDRDAIAELMRQSSQMQDELPTIAIYADWTGGFLNIRFVAANPPDQDRLVAFTQDFFKSLRITSVKTIRIFGYQATVGIPVWNQTVDLATLKNDSSIASAPIAPAELTPAELDLASPDGVHADLARSRQVSPASQPTIAKPVSLESALSTPDPDTDHFIVCGLGSLGQYCVLNLKRFALRQFEIRVTAIDKIMPDEWEVQNLLSLLADEPIVGDCRDDEVLIKAGIEQCRTILIVTNDDSVNVLTAIAARKLSPTVRIVIRSSRQNLNQLLEQDLKNFVAFEPTELPANAFALAGLREGVLGSFNIDQHRLRVVEEPVQSSRHFFSGYLAHTIHRKGEYRLLSYASADSTTAPTRAFFQWKTDTVIKSGDTIAYIEIAGSSGRRSRAKAAAAETSWQQTREWLRNIRQKRGQQAIGAARRWINARRIRQVAVYGSVLALFLWGVGLLLLRAAGLPPQKAMSGALILLLGGYGDLFGGLQADCIPSANQCLEINGWIQAFCGFIAVVSLVSVLGALGLFTDSLLSSRFNFFRKRLSIPKQDHVVLVGLGRVGQRVAAILRDYKQPLVALTENQESDRPTPYPLLVGDPIAELAKTNLATAKSMVVVTDDQMLNLEAALMARRANPDIGLVVRTYDQRFSKNLISRIANALPLTAYDLSAEAFAGAAFGENILGLFRLNEQTILVTEYAIAPEDTLVGKSLLRVACAYNVVPIFHEKTKQAIGGGTSEPLLPADDRQLLEAGDRLVVLSSINGLRRIEHAETNPIHRWRLEAKKPLDRGAQQEAGNILYRISGCSLDEARAFMNQLPENKADNPPGIMELMLYDQEADRLSKELSKQLPAVALMPL